jgi:hypothetical protein
MKIAVLVYGRLNKCVEHYNNIIHSIGNHNNIDFFLSSDNSSESLLNDFIHLYKPILYTNAPIHYDYDLSRYPGKKSETNIHNMTCHFINKNRVFSLLEKHVKGNGVCYDVIISLRIDLKFYNCFDFNNLLDNTVYIPLERDYFDNAMNDQVAYGKFDVIKKYNCINVIHLLENKLTIPHPESLNFANIHFNKLQVKRVNLKYDLDK